MVVSYNVATASMKDFFIPLIKDFFFTVKMNSCVLNMSNVNESPIFFFMVLEVNFVATSVCVVAFNDEHMKPRFRRKRRD